MRACLPQLVAAMCRGGLFLSLALFAGVALPACGGSGGGANVERTTIKVTQTPEGMLVPKLGSRCYDLQVKLEKRQSEDKARPVRMAVRVTPKTIGGPAKPLLPGTEVLDDVFAKAMRGGQVQATFVVGLAGTGKSAFARTLESRVCEDLPTARVDLFKDVHSREGAAESPNAVLAAAARNFGLLLPPTAKPGKHIDAGLGHKPWLLILDSLDELPIKARPGVLKQVRAALKEQPKMRLVILARPPVYAPAFQLPEVAGVVELLPQSCDDVDATVTVWQAKDSRLSGIDGLMSAYKLNAKTQQDGACYYRHLMTWRDVSMAMDLARLASQGHKSTPAEKFDGSRAAYVRLWITSDLDQITKRAGIAPEQSLELIERMMVKRSPKLLDIDLAFDEPLCAQVATSMSFHSTEKICRHLFRSHVFGARGRLNEYRFANRSVRDWFIAYRIDMDMRRAKQASCAPVAMQHKLFESSDIASFLVGMPQGRGCLAEALRQLCKARVMPVDIQRLIERGLPVGAARQEAVAAAKAKLDSKAPIDACGLEALGSM